MISKSKQSENQETEVDYENLLLKRYRIVEEVMEVAKEFNREVEPFRETGDARRYECDNCGHIEFDASITERVGESERLTGSARKKD